MKRFINNGLLGVAVGDALGGTTEFMFPNEIKQVYGKVTEIIGGGYWDLEPGETTDDTAMTIAVAKGILMNPEDPIEHIGQAFLQWYESNPKDIGNIIRRTFLNYKESGNWFAAAKATHDQFGGKSAGNGSLMRCLPIALLYSDLKKMEEVTILQSKMTHYDDIAAEACLIYNRIARKLLEGEELQTAIESEIKGTIYEPILASKPDCPPDGYVVHTMKWVLHWLLTCQTFEEVVINAANMGGDSDTIAAIAGGLKGLQCGIPITFRKQLKDSDLLRFIGTLIYFRRKKSFSDYDQNQFIQEIKWNGNILLDLLEMNAYKKDQSAKFQKLILDWRDFLHIAINILGSTIKKEDSQYEKLEHVFAKLKRRYERFHRFVDLGVPETILMRAVNGLFIYVDHFDQIIHGIEPKYTKEQLEELEWFAEIEKDFE